jgi:hypothetical protein
MQESWIDQTEDTIRDDVIEIAKTDTGLTNFKSTGVLRGFLQVLSSVVFFIYKTAINPIYKNASLDKATGIFLTLKGLALGVVRKSDVKATGNFQGHTYGDGNIPAGAWIIVEGTELRYKVTTKTAFASGVDFAIPVEAEFSGSDYNIGAEMPVRCNRVINGLDSVSVPDNWQTAFGENTEDDDTYRGRVKDRWKSQTLGDTKTTYKYYAEEVSGVREAKIIRTPRGPGSTDVVIASVTGLPTDELLQAVHDNLNNHELMAFDVQIKAPGVTTIEVTVEFSGNADEADVSLVAENYVHSLGIGARFAIKDLYALYEPLDLDTCEITSPARDVEPGEENIIVATITATKDEAQG